MLILTLADGYDPALKCIHSMEHLSNRDKIYTWLIKNKLVGERLYNLFHEHKFSWLRVQKFVENSIDKQKMKVKTVRL